MIRDLKGAVHRRMGQVSLWAENPQQILRKGAEQDVGRASKPNEDDKLDIEES